MISVQTIVDRINFELDAEGSDRYVFERDHIYAINAAQDWLVSLFNASFAENKLSEESLKELAKTKIWRTSDRSRFAFDAAKVAHSLWTILAIFPKITYTGSVTSQPTPSISVYQPNLIFLTSTEVAKRTSIEEWQEKNRNIFQAGNDLLNWADYADYAYTNFMDYDDTLSNPQEIEIAPAVNNDYIAMSYLKEPDAVTLVTDNLEFPAVLTDMVVNKALQFMALKQGDEQATLYKLTQSELAQLIKLMT